MPRAPLDQTPLTALRCDHAVNDHCMQFVPMWALESRAHQQAICAAAGSSLAPSTDGKRGNQPAGKLIDENQLATRAQNACALCEAGELIGPMVERCAADHEVNRRIRVRQLLGDSAGEGQSFVVGEASGCLDHVGGGVNSGKLLGLRVTAGQCPQEVSGSASHVENTLRCGRGGDCQRGGAVTDGVMQTTAPAPVVAHSTIVVGAKIAIGLHDGNSRSC
jgi:hypothetical protein